MTSIKDFARDCGVSYEAVRKQIKRYEKELEGHIHRQGRTQYLDDVAVAFLSEHRYKPEMVLYEGGADDRRVQELQEEVNRLREKAETQAERIFELAEWKAEHALALVSAEQTQLALEASEAAQKDLEASRDEYKAKADENAQRAAEEAQKAAEAVQREQDALKEVQDLREQLEASERRIKNMGLFEFLRERKKGRQK